MPQYRAPHAELDTYFIGSVYGCSGNQLFSIQSEIAFNQCKRKSLNFMYLGWISLVEIFHDRLGGNHMSMQDVYAQIQNPFCQIPERFFQFQPVKLCFGGRRQCKGH